ncbi:ATP-binding protein [Dactylosporangium sp. AC04546]|uniref:ATP-binding protein n=1 Tax=Dactylosporangium sp. AC04546 TaxID=2862460 RepID=UPI001EE14763|nr:ATP-binding protein [Dactylosporangium sp. AC04546]WVK83706.1 ATP-binding protein [Dactylosporangium sp. AC04546]
MDADQVEVDVPAGHARHARRVIAQALDAWGLAHLSRGAVMVGHELVANALRHGMPPAILRLLRRGDVLVIEVGDRSEQVPEIAEIDNATSISGRGLRIVTKLTRAWGVRRHAGGKVVWAEIAL